MNTLMQSSFLPSFRSMMEDFWNSEKWFEKSFLNGENLPAVNIKENEKSFDVEVAAPGFHKEDFKIDIGNGILNISAETKKEDKKEKNNYTRREFSYSSFSRSFTLPDSAAEEDIKARYEDGILHLMLKKIDKLPASKKMISVE